MDTCSSLKIKHVSEARALSLIPSYLKALEQDEFESSNIDGNGEIIVALPRLYKRMEV